MAMKNKKANKVANKRLKEAAKHLKANDESKFYEEVTKALWGYLSDKLMIPIAEFTRETANDKLKQKNIDELLLNELNTLLDTCEYARYAPSAVNATKQEIFDQAAKTIRSLESLL